jgi:hypothetical protein
MTSKFVKTAVEGQPMANALRNWVMVVSTIIFVLLYGAALVGWLNPLADEKMVSRLEPIIFVIIGYYFGRLPSQQNEDSLKQEIYRQTQRSDAAQHAKEQMQQAREGLEEKLKNVRAALMTNPPVKSGKELTDSFVRAGKDEVLQQSVALNILNS